MANFKKRSYLGSNYDQISEKLQKKAHDVWDMSAQGDQVAAIRKKQDTAKVSEQTKEDVEHEFSDITPGDLVLLFLGGKELRACVLEKTAGKLRLASEDGTVEVPEEWVRKAE